MLASETDWYTDPVEPFVDTDILGHIMALGDKKTASAISITCQRLFIHFVSRYRYTRAEQLKDDVAKKMRAFVASSQGTPIDLREQLEEMGGLIRGTSIGRVLSHNGHFERRIDNQGGLECLVFLKSFGERKSVLKEVTRKLTEKLNAATPGEEWYAMEYDDREAEGGENMSILIRSPDRQKSDITITGTELSMNVYMEAEAKNTWDTIFFNGESLLVYDQEQFVKLIDRKVFSLNRGLLRARDPSDELYKLAMLKSKGYSIGADSALPESELEKIKSMLLQNSREERRNHRGEYFDELVEDIRNIRSKK